MSSSLIYRSLLFLFLNFLVLPIFLWRWELGDETKTIYCITFELKITFIKIFQRIDFSRIIFCWFCNIHFLSNFQTIDPNRFGHGVHNEVYCDIIKKFIFMGPRSMIKNNNIFICLLVCTSNNKVFQAVHWLSF